MLTQRCWPFIPVYLPTTNTATLVIVFRPVILTSRRVVTQTDLFFILKSDSSMSYFRVAQDSILVSDIKFPNCQIRNPKVARNEAIRLRLDFILIYQSQIIYFQR